MDRVDANNHLVLALQDAVDELKSNLAFVHGFDFNATQKRELGSDVRVPLEHVLVDVVVQNIRGQGNTVGGRVLGDLYMMYQYMWCNTKFESNRATRTCALTSSSS